MTINEKMYLVTADDDTTIIGVATTEASARAYALAWLDKQYTAEEWETILEDEDYASKEDLWHDMMNGMEDRWEKFSMDIQEIPVLDKLIG